MLSICKQLTNKLEQLALEGARDKGWVTIDGHQVQRHLIRHSVEDQDVTITVVLEDFDRFSGTFNLLNIVCEPPLAARSAVVEEYLRHRAESVIYHLNYLVEPLILVELDIYNATAQLRSVPLQKDVDERDYWEVLLHLGERYRLKMSRYHWSAQQPEREIVSYPIIYGNLARMAEDLALVLIEGSER